MANTPVMSDPVLHILLALSDEPRHGYGIVQEIEHRTGGRVRLGTGTLYSALKRLRTDGLIVETGNDDRASGGRKRRTYRLTRLGTATLTEQTQRLQDLFAHASQKKQIIDHEPLADGAAT